MLRGICVGAASGLLVLLGASSACGLQLDVSADPAEAGTSSSSSSSSSGVSGSSGASSSSGATTSSSSSSSSSSSGEPVQDASADATLPPDAGNCTTLSYSGLAVVCPLLAGSTVIPGLVSVSCTRVGSTSDSTDLLVPDTNTAASQAGAFWVNRPLGKADTFIVSAEVELSQPQYEGDVGRGFTLALVRKNAGSFATYPLSGGTDGALGLFSLTEYAGLAAALPVQSGVASALAVGTAPNNGAPPAPSSTTFAYESGRIVANHAAGEDKIFFSYEKKDGTVLTPTPIPVTFSTSPIENGIEWIGVTASAGMQQSASHRLRELRITTCL